MDITERLFKEQAESLDYEIVRSVPILQNYFDSSSLIPQQLSPLFISIPPPPEFFSSFISSLQSFPSTQKSEIVNPIVSPKPKRRGRKRNSNDQQSEFLIVKAEVQCRKRRSKKPKSHPTKNFLQNFKVCHFDFLERVLGKQNVMASKEAKSIKEKKGISLKDYENLYNTPEFESAFKLFFARRVLYRELISSRSILAVKKMHHKKLRVFEQAFKSKRFERIN